MSYKEIAVSNITELRDGEMKQVGAGGTQILLARVKGKYHAVGPYCPHYGAPLVEGALNGERLVCPLHHSCFNVTTGDLQEPPALDALPCYEVKLENDQVIVRIPRDVTDRRAPEMTKRDPRDERLFAIAGGGAAGYTAAQTLREDGFKGRVVLISRERRLPYDRPNLSKDYLQGTAQPEWMPLRQDEFYAEQGIEVLREKEIARIDAAKQIITFTDGENLVYDSLLLATGGTPLRPNIPGSDLKNIFVLRSFDDADAIIQTATPASRAVVVGASFIGMETAASLTLRKLSVTVVTPHDFPFKKTLGVEIGKLMQQVHEAHGVQFRLGASAARFEGDTNVKAVVLDSGERIETDLVILGVGVKPATDFVEGVKLHTDGGVIVDEHMRAAAGCYAAGDIAYFPNSRTSEHLRIEHWRTAMQQGRVAAHNMAGKSVMYESVPFFWTHQFDLGLLYVGHATSWDEIVFQGDVSKQNFLASYALKDRVNAVAGMNRDRDMAAIEELMRLDQMPSATQLKTGSTNFLELLSGIRTVNEASG